MNPQLTFKVLRDFQMFSVGEIITPEDAPGADFPWLVKVGTVAPCAAGPMPLMSAGVDTAELLDEVEHLTNEHGPMKAAHETLKSHVLGMHATLQSALTLATERSADFAKAVAFNGELLNQCEEDKRRANKLAVELEQTKSDLAAARTAQASAPPPVTAAPGPSQSIGDAPPAASGAPQPQTVPAPNETEQTVSGKPKPGKPGK